MCPEDAQHQRPYLSSRTRPHDPFRSQGCCGSPVFHTSLVNLGVERVIYTLQAQGGAFVQRRRAGHMSHPQQHGHRNNRRQWSLIFCFHVSACQKGPQRVPLQHHNIPWQCCWNRTFMFSQKLRVVHYHNMF